MMRRQHRRMRPSPFSESSHFALFCFITTNFKAVRKQRSNRRPVTSRTSYIDLLWLLNGSRPRKARRINRSADWNRYQSIEIWPFSTFTMLFNFARLRGISLGSFTSYIFQRFAEICSQFIMFIYEMYARLFLFYNTYFETFRGVWLMAVLGRSLHLRFLKTKQKKSVLICCEIRVDVVNESNSCDSRI